MNRNIIAIIIVLLVVVGITSFVFYIQARTPKYKWETDYIRKSVQPYGLKSFYEVLKSVDDSISSVSNERFDLLDTSKTNTTLLAIDSYIEFDSLNITYLLDYIRRGNHVFVSTDEAPILLLESIFPDSVSVYEYDQYEDSVVQVNFASTQLPFPEKMRFHNQYLKKIKRRNWAGYYGKYFDENLKPYNAVPISYFKDTIVNCFYVPYGKGRLILHSNPILFTNYHMIQKNGFKHANNIFSYLNKGRLYWNEYQYLQSQSSGKENNPLKFLFSHYSLRTGWYLFLISIVIFIVFRSKREQRIIPVIYKNKNTSIEYAKAIGSLYYQKKAHHQIANELYNLFLADIRTRYRLDTSVKEKELIEQMAGLTEIKEELLTDLFELFADIKYNVNASPRELVKLYHALENYYNLKK